MPNQEDIFSTKEGRWDFTIAITVMALMGYFIYAFAFKDSPSNSLEAKNQVITTSKQELVDEAKSTPKAISTNTIWTNESPYQISKVPRRGALDGRINEEAKIITDVDVDYAADGPAKVDSDVNSSESSTAQTSKERRKEETDIKPITEGSGKVELSEEEKVVKSPKVEPSVSESVVAKKSPAPALDAKSKCAVIIGAFKYQKNVERIVQKLEEMGQPMVRGETFRNLEYVGVPVECNDPASQRELVLLLNQTFDIESWVKKQ